MPTAKYGLGWRPDTPDLRDRIYRSKTAVLPSAIDLEPQFAQISALPFDQGQLGSCTANAISAAILFAEHKEGAADKTPTVPARLGIYYYERLLENTVNSDSGAEIRDGLKVVAKRGYVDEKQWPYDIATFTKDIVQIQPGAEHVISYHRIRQNSTPMAACIAEGYPFVFGITVYSSFMDAPNGDIPMPSSGEQVEGGHAILCVGYDSKTRRFKFLNSWGSSWGRSGFGTIPFDYLTHPSLDGDYWTIRSET